MSLNGHTLVFKFNNNITREIDLQRTESVNNVNTLAMHGEYTNERMAISVFIGFN